MSSETLARLENGTLPPGRIADVGRHLRECDSCRAAVQSRMDVPLRVAGVRQLIAEDELHLTFEDLAAIASGGSSERITHLERCAVCREDLEDLRALRPKRSRLPLFAAAAAVFIIVLGWFALRPKPEPIVERPPVATAMPNIPPPQKPRTPDAVNYGRADWNAWVATALKTRRLAMPAVVAELKAGSISLRGDNGAPSKTGTIISPYGAIVRDARPTFRWTAPAGAEAVVQVFDARNEIAKSEPTRARQWRTRTPLRADETYTWQVTIRDGEHSYVMPQPPAPPALFRVLDANARQMIAEAEKNFPDDHLLLAVIYAHYGLEEDARAAVRKYAEKTGSPEAKAMLESLRR